MSESEPTSPSAPAVTGKMAEVTDLPPIAAKAAEVKAEAGVAAAIVTTAGQRRVNLLWEVTQLTIAISTAWTALGVSSILAVRLALQLPTFEHVDPAVVVIVTTSLALLSNAFFLVVGFYFGRTNHQRTGGVGSNDSGR